MARRTITEISVEDVEKRRLPGKHYVYVIVVQWSDEMKTIVYRRYSKFYDLQCHLLVTFPDDAGMNDPYKRILPFLPGKILFGRSHIRDVALKRLNPINHYCKRLVHLPSRISQCKAVLDFFDTWPEDLNALRKNSFSENGDISSERTSIREISEPVAMEQYLVIADYKKEARNEVTVYEGQVVDVFEKNASGWWFVHIDTEQGWVPSPYLERMDGSPDDRVIMSQKVGRGERYLCHIAFEAANEDEISLEKGCLVEVTEKNLDGWWMVRYQDEMGRAPATNLIRVDTLRSDRIVDRPSLEPPKPKPMPVVPKAAIPTPFNAKDHRDSHVKPKYHPPSSSGSPSSSPSGSSGIHKPPVPPPVAEDDDDCVYENIFVNPSPKNDALKESMSKFLNNAPIYSKEYVMPPRKRSVPKGPHGRREPHVPKVSVKYLTTKDFPKGSGDSLGFKAGQEVEVIEKTENGWWLVKIGDQEGWAPVSYLQIKKTVEIPSTNQPSAPPKPPPPAADKVKHLVNPLQQPDRSDDIRLPARPPKEFGASPKPERSDGPKPPVRPPKEFGASPQAKLSSVPESPGIPPKAGTSQPKPVPRVKPAGKPPSQAAVWSSESALNNRRQDDMDIPLPTVRKSSFIEDLQRNLLKKRPQAAQKKPFTPVTIGLQKDQKHESHYSEIDDYDDVKHIPQQPLGVAPMLEEGEEEEEDGEQHSDDYDDVEHADDLIGVYIAKKKFKAVEEGEMSMSARTRVRLLKKTDTGWCLVKNILTKKEGWVPEVLLHPALKTSDPKSQSDSPKTSPVYPPKERRHPPSSPFHEPQNPKPDSPIEKAKISTLSDEPSSDKTVPSPTEKRNKFPFKQPSPEPPRDKPVPSPTEKKNKFPLKPPDEPPRDKPVPSPFEKRNKFPLKPPDEPPRDKPIPSPTEKRSKFPAKPPAEPPRDKPVPRPIEKMSRFRPEEPPRDKPALSPTERRNKVLIQPGDDPDRNEHSASLIAKTTRLLFEKPADQPPLSATRLEDVSTDSSRSSTLSSDEGAKQERLSPEFPRRGLDPARPRKNERPNVFVPKHKTGTLSQNENKMPNVLVPKSKTGVVSQNENERPNVFVPKSNAEAVSLNEKERPNVFVPKRKPGAVSQNVPPKPGLPSKPVPNKRPGISTKPDLDVPPRPPKRPPRD